jgi:hypothetical protein
MSIRFSFRNPSPHVEGPTAEERYETYDLVSALYDYKPPGLEVEVSIGGNTVATFCDGMVAYTARQLFSVADRLLSCPKDLDESAWLRESAPDLPRDWRVYCARWVEYRPPWVLSFATDGANVWVYQRSRVEVAEDIALRGVSRGRLEVHEQRGDSLAPFRSTRCEILDELRAFLTRYLDDLIASFSFLRGEPIYEYWRSRLGDIEVFAGIPGPHPSRADPEQWRRDKTVGGTPSTPPGDPMDDPRVKAAFDDLAESLADYQAQVEAAKNDDNKA